MSKRGTKSSVNAGVDESGGPAGLATRPIEGHVDAYRHDCISGWAFDPARPGFRVPIEVLHGGKRLCLASADLFREDLHVNGYGDGNHGFEIALPLDIFAEPTVMLHIRVADGGGDLLGSPLVLQNDRAQLDEAVLAKMGKAIVSTVEAAQTAESLADLAGWLIQHFDTVYQRQALLSSSARARAVRFETLIGGNMTLSDMLRQAAEAVAGHYPMLELPMPEMPEVSVIIPAFNNFDVTYRCLQSIVMHKAKVSFEVVVVDDASTDETLYAALVLSGGIQVVRNSRNVGFLHSILAGVRAARGGFLFLLNSDCEVHEGWLDSLVATFADDPRVGIAGSKLLFPDGRLQEAGGIVFRQGSGWNYGRFEDPEHPRYCFMRDADYVSGAALMVRRSIFERVGGFSEEFAPGYYEDTDLCFKVRKAGYRVVVQPQSRVTHYEGISSGTDPEGPGMKRFQRINKRTFLLKWFDVLQSHSLSEGANPHRESERGVRRRVLFIDETVPTPDRDAGSNAALEHMRALQRLGFKVSFVGADNMAKISPYTDYLEAIGIEGYYARYYWSVEEVLRRRLASFDLFYIHRFANMHKYAAIIRLHFPEAIIVYNVADLHYLRLEREAELTDNLDIRQRAAQMRHDELAAIAVADRVIVHSSFEEGILAQILPGRSVHVIPWSFKTTPVAKPLLKRSGLAFVGGFNHRPNVDAALWLVHEIMPLVWLEEPDMECLLIGADMPDQVRALGQQNVRVLGHLPELGPTFEQIRLTVAPLRYGAGLKGKVLTSLAFGLPCVSTPCAVEGMGLPGCLEAMVAPTAVGLAARILTVHRNEGTNQELSRAGLAFIAENFSDEVTDTRLRRATQLQGMADRA